MGKKAIVGAIVVFVVLGMTVAVLVPKKNVTDATLTKCKFCSREIASTVQSRRVPWWDSTDYHVDNRLDYCADCGDASVSYTVETLCQHCGKVHQSEAKQALRREERQSQKLTSGYCSACLQPVNYDVRLVCQECKKVYRTDTKSAPAYTNPRSEEKTEGFCPACSKPVQWRVSLQCEECGETYDARYVMAAPKDHAKHEARVGLCKWCKVRAGVKNLGQRAGEVTGDAIEGIVKGAQNR
jgi:hypothetical protein